MTGPGSLWLDQLRAEVLRRIKAQRSTQAALAAHLGITPKHMSQVLTGRVNGRGRAVKRLARWLHGILCPACFDRRAEAMGIVVRFEARCVRRQSPRAKL